MINRRHADILGDSPENGQYGKKKKKSNPSWSDAKCTRTNHHHNESAIASCRPTRRRCSETQHAALPLLVTPVTRV
jgi:hypothetical protein